jgi:hypothetical protein
MSGFRLVFAPSTTVLVIAFGAADPPNNESRITNH